MWALGLGFSIPAACAMHEVLPVHARIQKDDVQFVMNPTEAGAFASAGPMQLMHPGMSCVFR